MARKKRAMEKYPYKTNHIGSSSKAMYERRRAMHYIMISG